MLSLLFGLVSVLMLGVGFFPPLLGATLLIFLGMTCLGMGNGAVFQLVPQRFREEIGVVTGIVGAAGGVGGFFLPTFLGFFKDFAGSYGVGFVIFGLTSLSALVILRFVQAGWTFRPFLSKIPSGLEGKMAFEKVRDR